MELTEASVDEDEGGKGLLVGLNFRAFAVFQSLVAAVDDFAHGGEVVDAGDGFDLEFAVVGFLHGAVFPDDHGGDGFGALDVGDVEALDAGGRLSEGEGVLEGVGDGALGGLEDTEALVVGLLGVLADEVDEGAFFAALGGGDLDAVAGAFGEEIGEEGAVGEVDGEVDGLRDVGLVEVELLEQGGEEGGGREALVELGEGGLLDGGAAGVGVGVFVGLVVLGGGLSGVGLEAGEGFGFGGNGGVGGELGLSVGDGFGAVGVYG